MLPTSKHDVLVMPIPNHLIEEYLAQGWAIDPLPWPHSQYSVYASKRVPKRKG